MIIGLCSAVEWVAVVGVLLGWALVFLVEPCIGVLIPALVFLSVGGFCPCIRILVLAFSSFLQHHDSC